MKLLVLSLAARDLQRGERFYEDQGEGLGDYFLDSLTADIGSLLLYAGIHRKVSGYQCLLSKTFPFAIYYRVSNDEIRVYRVLDCRQDPSKIRRALR